MDGISVGATVVVGLALDIEFLVVLGDVIRSLSFGSHRMMSRKKAKATGVYTRLGALSCPSSAAAAEWYSQLWSTGRR